jgi:hypothetical protein
MSQSALVALGAALATGGTSMLDCCNLVLECHGFQDAAAAYSTLLPMLMPTSVKALTILNQVSAAQLAAVCCPDSLAAVTRPVMLALEVEVGHTNQEISQIQAVSDAAGKSQLDLRIRQRKAMSVIREGSIGMRRCALHL